MKELHFDPKHKAPLLKDHPRGQPKNDLPATASHTHPKKSSTGTEDGTLHFIGTATTVIEWHGFRILTDPNFLHAGDHVHLGPGVNATRKTNPAVDLHELPPVDCVLLSHYHEDHFDRLVEDSLDRGFPIITTPHAKKCLSENREDPFKNVTELAVFEECQIDLGDGHAVKITGTPGKHVPPGPLSIANDFLQAVPPTNGWLIELGTSTGQSSQSGELDVVYRIYITGDTLLVDELKEIPKMLGENKQIDLMLVHLGGTTIPGPSAPLLMVTMDAKQGIQLMHLIDPDVTIPIHFDDYDVFLSPLSDFQEEVKGTKFRDRVVYLDRGEAYRFSTATK